MVDTAAVAIAEAKIVDLADQAVVNRPLQRKRTGAAFPGEGNDEPDAIFLNCLLHAQAILNAQRQYLLGKDLLSLLSRRGYEVRMPVCGGADNNRLRIAAKQLLSCRKFANIESPCKICSPLWIVVVNANDLAQLPRRFGITRRMNVPDS